MAILKIARLGQPVLTRIASPVADPGAPPLRRLVADMAATLADADGLGLAAPQVYQSLRLILFLPVRDRAAPRDQAPVALFNPTLEILDPAPELAMEGCLSMPGLRGLVPRARRIGYRGLDAAGRTVEREAAGLEARVVQHEIDHLDGVLYPMRMTDLRNLTFDSELRDFRSIQEGSDHD